MTLFQQELDSGFEKQGVNHQTIIVPYHTEGKDGPLDTLSTMLIAPLGKHGKKKGCKSQKSMKQYFSEKVEMFLDRE